MELPGGPYNVDQFAKKNAELSVNYYIVGLTHKHYIVK